MRPPLRRSLIGALILREFRILSSQKPANRDWKGRIGAVTGLVSLCVSLLTAYKTLLYEHYHVSVFTTQDRYALSSIEGRGHIEYSVTAIFVNLGTSNVTIAGADAGIRFNAEELSTRENCDNDPYKGLYIINSENVEPNTIKPGETMTMKMHFAGDLPFQSEANTKDTTDGYYGNFCAALRISFMSDDSQVKSIQVSASNYGITKNYQGSYTGQYFFGGHPYDLVDKRRWLVPF